MAVSENRAVSAGGGAMSLADDLMRGADAIRLFMFGENDDPKQIESQNRSIYHLASKGELGLFKMGGTLCGRKSTMLAKIAEAEGRAA